MSLKDVFEYPIRHFHHPDFDLKIGQRKLLKEMPFFEEYEQEKKKIAKYCAENIILPELSPMYVNPLLTKVQEQHLFKKMNYFKYRAVKLIENAQHNNFSIGKISKYLKDADAIKKELTLCNVRLVSMLFKKRTSLEKDDLFSYGYQDVMKAVDYFDYTRGFRFSTYCTWVLSTNVKRTSEIEQRYKNNVVVGHINCEELLREKQSNIDFMNDIHRKEKVELVERMLKTLNARQKEAVVRFFKLTEKQDESIVFIDKQCNSVKNQALKVLKAIYDKEKVRQ